MAIIGAGGIVSGSHPAYKTSELVHHFDITGARFVVTQNKLLDTVAEAASRCGIHLFDVFLFDEQNPELPSRQVWRALLQYGESDWITSTNDGCIGDKIAVYGSTSGTTGRPKVAALPHKYYTAQGLMTEARLKDRQYYVCYVTLPSTEAKC